MSIFSGKFHKLPGVKGKLTDRTPELRATMEQVDNGPKATVNRVAGITGAFSRVGRWFKAEVRPLDILYRFLAARQTVRQTHSAKETTAPAVTMEADSEATSRVEAPLTEQPTAEVKVDSQPYASVFARLVAYNRAAAVYIKHIFMGRTAELSAAHGAVVKYHKAMKLSRISEAEAAESAIMESRFNSFTAESEATASAAPAETTGAARTIPAEVTANASQADAIDVNIQTEPGTGHAAKMATWIDPVVEDGVLILRQVYSATQENKKLGVS